MAKLSTTSKVRDSCKELQRYWQNWRKMPNA